MPFSGGVFSVVNTFIPGTTILSSSMNSNFSDIATGLSDCLTRDNQAGMTAPLRLVDGTVGAPALTFSSETALGLRRGAAGKMTFVGGGAAVAVIDTTAPGGSGAVLLTSYDGNTAAVVQPVGMVVDFAGSTAPTGWLLCFGQSLLRASYPELFTAIGTTYGAADGSHFSLPDCRDRVSAGKGDMGGSDAARITVAGGNFDGTVLGGTQDTQSLDIAQNQLPNVNPSISASFSGNPFTPAGNIIYDGAGLNLINSITPVLNQISGNVVNFTPNAGGAPAIQTLNAGGGGNSPITPTAANKTLTFSGSGGTPSGSVSGTVRVNGNVTQQLTPIVQPTIILNKIIFAGR